jgi:hypothetical protein
MSRARDIEPRLRMASKPFEGVQLSKDKITKRSSKPAKAKTVTSKSKSATKSRATIKKKVVIKTKVRQVVEEPEEEGQGLHEGIQVVHDGTSTSDLSVLIFFRGRSD